VTPFGKSWEILAAEQNSWFGPDVHFSNWRNKQSEWTLGKEQRKEKALARAQQLRDEGKKNAQIAEVLNSEGLRSLTGRP
jgi:hypothetical protein